MTVRDIRHAGDNVIPLMSYGDAQTYAGCVSCLCGLVAHVNRSWDPSQNCYMFSFIHGAA